MKLIVAEKHPINERGDLPKENDGDWMRDINFEALDSHVTSKLETAKQGE